VRAQVGTDVFHECQSVVREPSGEISCSVRDHLGWIETAGAGAEHTLPDVYRELRIVRTTGQVRTERYLIGSATRPLASTDPLAVHWYVNDAAWRPAFATDSTGAATRGTVAALIDLATAGADLTVVVDWGMGRIAEVPCDTLRFDRASGRLACVTTLADIDVTGGGTGDWDFGVYNTDGVVRDRKVCFGSTASCGNDTRMPEGMTWMVRD